MTFECDSPGDIYDAQYFGWQKTAGEFGGKANLFKFTEHIKPLHSVLDFGCGGGYLLKNIVCARKFGIEINPAAAAIARENGVECYSSVDEIPDASIDVIISNHALEHVRNPFGVMASLITKLVVRGLLIVVVPCEATTLAYNDKDINQHIYTWNPQLLGNLAAQAGFRVVDVFPIYHKWPSNFLSIQMHFGWRIFHLIARLKGRANRSDFQVKLIAAKPGP